MKLWEGSGPETGGTTCPRADLSRLGLATANGDGEAATGLSTLVNLTEALLGCGRKPEASRYESLRQPPLLVNVSKGHVMPCSSGQRGVAGQLLNAAAGVHKAERMARSLSLSNGRLQARVCRETPDSREPSGCWSLRSAAQSIISADEELSRCRRETCGIDCGCWLRAVLARLGSEQTYCGALKGSGSAPAASTYSLGAFCSAAVSYLLLRVEGGSLNLHVFFLKKKKKRPLAWSCGSEKTLQFSGRNLF